MNRSRRLPACLISLLLSVHLFATHTIAAPMPTGAQSAQQIERERLARIMDPATDVEEFRQEVDSYLTEMADTMRMFNTITVVRKEMNRAGLKPLAMLAQAKRSMAELSTADLTAMREAYARVPGWRQQPTNIWPLLNPHFRQQFEIRIPRQKPGEVVTLAVADNCADGINAGITNTDIAIADAFRIAAEAIQDVVPAPLNFVAVAATAATKGVGASLASPQEHQR